MNCYLDSSTILRFVLKAPGYWKKFGSWQRSCSARITEIECYRTLNRMRILNESTPEELLNAESDVVALLGMIDILNLNTNIIERAKSHYSMHIRSLDAIHVSTALEWQREIGKPVTMISHDKRMNLFARYMGLEVIDGISP